MHAAILQNRRVEDDCFDKLIARAEKTLHSVFIKPYRYSKKCRGKQQTITRKCGFDTTKIIIKENSQTILVNGKKSETERFEWISRNKRSKAKVSRINSNTIKLCIFKFCNIAGDISWHAIAEMKLIKKKVKGKLKWLPIEMIAPDNMKHFSQKIKRFNVKVLRAKKRITLKARRTIHDFMKECRFQATRCINACFNNHMHTTREQNQIHVTFAHEKKLKRNNAFH